MTTMKRLSRHVTIGARACLTALLVVPASSYASTMSYDDDGVDCAAASPETGSATSRGVVFPPRGAVAMMERTTTGRRGGGGDRTMPPASSSPTNCDRAAIPKTSAPLGGMEEEDVPPRGDASLLLDCDYAIVGHGRAGRSAVRTIQRLDPTAEIVTIDPSAVRPSSDDDDDDDDETGGGEVAPPNGTAAAASPFGGRTRHLHARACHIDHSRRLIRVRSVVGGPTGDDDDAGGALRSDAVVGGVHYRKSAGFEALELAAHCARVSSSSSGRWRNNNDDDTKKVTLLFGNSGPMSKTLPRYLSSALTKRLRQNGVEVEERAMTRYVAMDRPMSSDANESKSNDRLELYTVKSYDNLDGKRILADLLVVAPSVDGLHGTAVIPTSGADGDPSTADHLPWSSLISPPLLSCYLDDGRISTNSEFHAASSLYAAGSVARYPNARTGRAEVAGGRHVSAELVGRVAATNMIASTGGGGTVGSLAAAVAPRYMQGSIPVWRSDVIPYIVNDQLSWQGMRSNSSTLALYSMGIHALCVGRCDSEGMATHGFWWTNTNQSIIESKIGIGGITESTNCNQSIGPNGFMRRATRNMTRKITALSNPSGSRGSLPVYGSGIVFYVDRSGNIEGIMLWGLPFSSNPSNVQSDLNNELVGRMKKLILSNGGVAIQDHSESIMHEQSGLNMDVSLLSYLHLAEESKLLASIALSGSRSAVPRDSASVDLEGALLLFPEELDLKQQTKRIAVRGRPLHRYTPIKPVGLTNLGKMRRTDETGVLTEENDLFYSSMASLTADATCQRIEEFARPPSLKRVDPMQIWMNLADSDELELQADAGRRKMQIERSRPPKEEPLWLRQGDEHRLVNKKKALADAFLRNISSGRFSDGKDAVRQAPLPKIYLDAKEMLNSWIASSDNEKED
ncbi:hypothetical protein ACHAW5_008118 [Stephanodiscus triporus]|uniref:Subtilisin n=1 Tax=Stephanodiscus triporus TaxID=2934178 RepID=A0ABD3P5V3_9STRA